MLRTVVFVPARNEAATLGGVLRDVRRYAGRNLAALVVADDGSTDATAEVAKGCGAYVVKTQGQNGNGVATRTALNHIVKLQRDGLLSHIDAVVRVDGDGQHYADLVGHLIAQLEECEATVFSRFHEKSDVSQAPANRLDINLQAARWMRESTGLNISDARSGYFGYRWECVEPIIDWLTTVEYGIPMEWMLGAFAFARRRNRPFRHVELPHQALYGPNMQPKNRQRWAAESAKHWEERKRAAYQVYKYNCERLGLYVASMDPQDEDAFVFDDCATLPPDGFSAEESAPTK